MGELTIRRNRGFAVPPRGNVGKTEKTAGGSPARRTAGTTGLSVSETLRQRISGQGEAHVRESRRTLQKGEAVLAEVQNHLERMEALARESAGGGPADREALQAELKWLEGEIDRIVNGASFGGSPLFLDGVMGSEEEMEALLRAIVDESDAGQEAVRALPDWLMNALTQKDLSPERLLAALGLDKTAGGREILSAIAGSSLSDNAAAGYLAALYLGAVIAGGGASGSLDPDAAMEGLRQLLEKVMGGTPPDEAVEALTNGEFSGMEDFQAQFLDGVAPGLQTFLVELLLSGGAPDDLLTLLTAAGGAGPDMLMELLAALSETEQSAAPMPESAAAVPAESGPAPGGRAVMELENVQVIGQDLSGVSEEDGVLTIRGPADVVIRGTGRGEQPVLLVGSGTVTIQDVRLSTLTVDHGEARIFSVGDSAAAAVELREGAALTLDGRGMLRIGAVRGETAALRLTGGAAALESEDGKNGAVTVPVVLDGPVLLAARALNVRSPEGKALEPFDIVWKTLLPGFSAVTSMTLDGRQVKMSLLAGDLPALARLWLDKGDPSSHGYPAHTLTVQGRDQFGRPRTRYAYLFWNQQAGGFQETSLFPNPFTVTGGTAEQDWVYEEETQTLRILSNQVTAISGGSGTDANQTPFSGRIALADEIGAMELTLGGVICRVASGRALHLGRENDVTLLLQSGTRNIFESGAGCAGISLGDGAQLRIDCPRGPGPIGMLFATGGTGGAGIGRDGGGSRDQTSGIRIQGGVITATGNGGGAGIGAGKHGPMGPVTVTGGTITATGGTGGGAGIGGALGAPVGDITIRGGTVTAVAVCHAAAIGAGVQGASGNILITGAARIVKAQGGNPGADIGACLFGGCGKVQVSGGADIGGARLNTDRGISLQMGDGAVTLPQFRLSSKALRLDAVSVLTQEEARAAGAALEADRRWVSHIQTAYSALYNRLERGGRIRRGGGPVRDTGAADVLLEDTRRSILRQSTQAMQTHSGRSGEDVGQLLR